MAEGLQLVADPADWLPGTVSGWRLVAAAGWATLTAPDATIVYDGELALWPSCRQEAIANGWVWLGVGVVGLGEGCDIGQALRTAAGAGLLASGLAAASFPGPLAQHRQ
ncbi:hypothetical protein HS048_21625 [Planomonospora sp. ID91781]|uniref:hypothetical protein n=1 Tax=Planomonospora sp. ID91781 TaxID=2738135 RepID=UPI0018C4438A|nr:hypothetical protein [Planomonospora sp. ID91781]MBG0823333.1 hypothetical protein [Planomonospora sp. ID91781]